MKTIASRLARKLPAALWLMCLIPSPAADVGFVAVMKGQEFAQTSANIVAIGEWRQWNETGEALSENDHWEPLYMFEVFALGTAVDAITSGTVTVPVSGGQEVDLMRDYQGDEDDAQMGIENGYFKPLNLDTARPDGSYGVELVTKTQGTLNIPLSLSGGAYPPVPQITNFDALQAASASSSIMVQWTSMGGTEYDFIHVKVMQIGGEDDGFIVWESDMPGDPNPLNGTDTQVSIPPNVLQFGTDYHAEVLFVKTTEVKTPPVWPALSIAGYYKLTGFRIRTAALTGQALGAKFLRGTPQDTWSDIPVDSGVAFHFSHPMSPAHISIDWTRNGGPLNTGNFNYEWIQGNTVLLCTFSNYTPGQYLPPNSVIGWTLNLGSFLDANGRALDYGFDDTPSDSFRTSMDAQPACPPDVGFISIIKTRYHIQEGVAPVADGRYEASVEVETNATNRLESTSITVLANGSSAPLYCDPWDASEYEAPGEYGSKTDLDRFYPNGSYQFDMAGLADGAQTVTLSLGATDKYPPAPTVTNLAALQVVDPNSDCTITWNPLPDWNNDFETFGPDDRLIEIEVSEDQISEVFYVDPFKLENGTQVTIPAGTLKPGKTYQARLFFSHVSDIDEESYPDAFAVAAFESQTVFTIKTTGEPLMPALALQRLGGAIRINATGGEINVPYALEASHNLQRWTPLERYWNNGAPHQFDDTDAQYLKARFYRVRDSGIFEELIPHIAIQGTVWTNSSHSTPVAGAVVGTSLDGQTAVTDAQGRFFLVTDTPSQNGGALYSITVNAGAQNRSFGPWNWGDQPRNQVFEMQ